MTKKIVFGVAVVALAVLVMAPAASAACGGVRTASTYNSVTGGFVYWTPVSGDVVTATVAQVWQAGAPANADYTSALCGDQILYINGAGLLGLNLHMESCGGGCPAPNSTLGVLAQYKTGTGTPAGFVFGTKTETPAAGINFDYSTDAYQMVRLPQPFVVSSGPRAGNLIPVHLTVPGVASGLQGSAASTSHAGYKIVQALSTANPGNDASAYGTVLATIAAPAGAPGADTLIQVDCTGADAINQKDAWIATQLSFEAGAKLSLVVSEPKRVHCSGSIATPNKFTVVPKKGTGTGTQN